MWLVLLALIRWILISPVDIVIHPFPILWTTQRRRIAYFNRLSSAGALGSYVYVFSILQNLRSIVAMNENLKKQEQQFRAHCKVKKDKNTWMLDKLVHDDPWYIAVCIDFFFCYNYIKLDFICCRIKPSSSVRLYVLSCAFTSTLQYSVER